MSDPSETHWSNRPNAPQIPSSLYLAEKEYFAGNLIGIISYGIVVALFFRCMGVLLSPANPIKRGIKWALVAHTVALFLFLTIPLGIGLNVLSIEYIDNREFPASDGFPPGPIGYDNLLDSEPISVVLYIVFPLNQWLADGLLLHRCYVVYSMNHWVMAFPCLMYLASVVLGIAYIYYDSGVRFYTVIAGNISTSYLSICLSLNVLLTLMIVMRLVVHVRNLRKVTGSSNGSSGLHTTAVTVVMMLIESYALYAVTLLLYVVPWAVESTTSSLFSEVIVVVQVIAPYLIILRVAKRRAVTRESISGTAESIHFRSQESTDGDGSHHGGDPSNAMEANGEAPGEPGAGDAFAIEEVPL